MQRQASPLATPEQSQVETRALQLIATPEARPARERARALLRGDQAARSPDGVMGLDRALDQWVLALAMRVANDDPDRPNVVWNVDNTPRPSRGVGADRPPVAADNPDNATHG